MYESFFGLAKRPFSAMPDPDCFIPIDGIYQAYSSLMQCAVDGRGIGVLTAPAGLGKTLVCQRMARELEDRFTVVFLPNSNFLTRRSLLQSILFELGHSYVRMGDQELRLELTSVIRRLRPGHGTIILIVDEAHLLAPRMLEELRTLSNFAEAGESLVRLVVAGQLSLEEMLSEPSLDAFNQRIGIQTTIDSLTRDESVEYVSRRLALAGANVTEVLTRDGLAVICEASDGSPRCLNQLCDHSLLLGYLGSEKPVSHLTVRDALDDLKQLPLSWSEPVTGRSRSVEPTGRARSVEIAGGSRFSESTVISSSKPARDFDDEQAWIVTPEDETEPADFHGELGSIEFGHAVEETPGETIEIGEPASAAVSPTRAIGVASGATIVRQQPVEIVVAAAPAPADVVDEIVDEEVVIDRYAALDAALSRLTRTMMCARVISRRNEPSSGTPANPKPVQIAEEADEASPAFDVVLPEDAPVDMSAAKSAPERRIEQPADKGPARPLSGRRYERLFSELRRRRIGA